MRPINRGGSPQIFVNYQDAKPFLVGRLGTYCSFCERRIPTNLAVEHILPKDEALPYAHLRNEWTNFLLACVNCNSAKKNQVILFDQYLLPDRDNTFPYYNYVITGDVEVIADDPIVEQMAQNTLDLVALNRTDHIDWDEDAMFSALERISQRIQACEQAMEAKDDYDNGLVNVRSIGREAASCGFFSIWMNVFHDAPLVRQRLIQVFTGTATDCFDVNTNVVMPRANNGLQDAGKA